MFVRASLVRQTRPGTARVAASDRTGAADRTAAAGMAGAAGTAVSLLALAALGRRLAAIAGEAQAGPITVDGVVAGLVIGIGSILTAWYALTGVALVAGAVLRRGLGVAHWGAPALRRLAAGTALGAAAALGTLPAMAATAPPDDLSWGAVAESAAELEDAEDTESAGNAEAAEPAEPADAAESAEAAEVADPAGPAEAEPPSGPATSEPTPLAPTASEQSAFEPLPSDATLVEASPAQTGPAETGPESSATAAPSPAVGSAPQAVADQPAALHSPGTDGAIPAPWVTPAAPLPSWAFAPAGPPAPSGPPAMSAEYVVVPGDCLWTIAEAHLGGGATDSEVATRVTEMIAANPSLASNPDLIHPGDVLTVPALTVEASS